MTFRLNNYPADVRVMLCIYSIGFLIGTFTHLQSLVVNGFLGQGAPLLIRLYWDSLALLDPLAAILIWIKPRLGIMLAVMIMLTDVMINTYCYLSGIFGEPVPGMVPIELFLQSLFATYVFVTAPVII